MCVFCGGDVEWVHNLDQTRVRVRVFGKEHTFGPSVDLCDRCELLYREGDDEGLVRLQATLEHTRPDWIEETIRSPLAVLRDADRGAVPLNDTLPPGVGALRAAGFVPVEHLTGDPDIGRLWPVEHSRSVPETRPGFRDDPWASDAQDEFWLVRSPWSAITTREAVDLLWQWTRRHEPTGRGGEDVHRQLVGEFLALTTDEVLAFRAQGGF